MSVAENPATEPEPAEEFPESWLPWKHNEQPRTLVGTVTDYSLGPDLGYGRNWICTVQARDDRTWSVWLSQDVLVREFEDQRPMPGEEITLRYRGFQHKPKGGGRPYHAFRLTVDRGPQLPEFLTRPRLGAGEPEPDIPADTSDLPPVPDAEVVEERDAQEGGDDDDSVPF